MSTRLVAPREQAVFGGVVVTREGSAGFVNLGSSKDVRERLEAWNLPSLVGRGAGKSDTKVRLMRVLRVSIFVCHFVPFF